jgi:tetratricopeptide (TPR) repeat protein
MLRHLPFFEALADTAEDTPEWAALTAGLGVLRLVDEWREEGSVSRLRARPTAVAIEQVALGRPARTVLQGIVNVLTGQDAPSLDLLTPRLFAYGRSLELDGRYALAADVYATVVSHEPAAEHTDLTIDTYMRLGYCLRVLGRFDEAGAAYGAAKQLSTLSGDTVKALRGRVADANLALARGNLPVAAAILEETIQAAEGDALHDVRMIALHDRAVVAFHAGKVEDAVRIAFQALEGTRAPMARDRLLSDIAAMWVQLGVRRAARDAFLILLATAQEQYTRWLATVNLMDLAALDGVEVAFEQYRRELAAAALPADLAASSQLVAGQGYRLLGRTTAARRALTRAAELAEQHQLHRVSFEAEEALAALEQGERRTAEASQEPPESLRAIATALTAMRELATAS